MPDPTNPPIQSNPIQSNDQSNAQRICHPTNATASHRRRTSSSPPAPRWWCRRSAASPSRARSGSLERCARAGGATLSCAAFPLRCFFSCTPLDRSAGCYISEASRLMGRTHPSTPPTLHPNSTPQPNPTPSPHPPPPTPSPASPAQWGWRCTPPSRGCRRSRTPIPLDGCTPLFRERDLI